MRLWYVIGTTLGVLCSLPTVGCGPKSDSTLIHQRLELEDRDAPVGRVTIDVAAGRSIVSIHLSHKRQDQEVTVSVPCDPERAGRVRRYIAAVLEEHQRDISEAEREYGQARSRGVPSEDAVALLDPGLRVVCVIGLDERRQAILVRTWAEDPVLRACVGEVRAAGGAQLALAIARVVVAESISAEDANSSWDLMEEAWDGYNEWRRETGLKWTDFPAVRFRRESGMAPAAGVTEWSEVWRREFRKQGIVYSVSGRSIVIEHVPVAPWSRGRSGPAKPDEAKRSE